MDIFIVYIIYYNLFQISDYSRYFVWLIIQINVWNEFYALAQFTITFHLKVIFFENLNLPHTYGQSLRISLIMNWKLSNMFHKHGSKYVESHVK